MKNTSIKSSWKSDDTAKATVTPPTDTVYPSKGTITGVKAGKTKVKVDYVNATDPKLKAKAEVKVNVGRVQYEKTRDCQGFDDTTKDASENTIYWLVVKESGTNNVVRANIEPNQAATHVSFNSSNPGVATVAPANAAHDNQVLTVTGVASGAADIQAQFDNTDAEKLQVVVKKKKTLRMTFNYVSDNAGHHTRRSHAEANTFITRLNEIWGPQANVEFVLNQVRDIQVNQDLTGVVDFIKCTATITSNCGMRSPDVLAIINQADTTADRNVYFVWETEPSPVVANQDVDAFAATPGTDLLLEDNLGGNEGQIISHEEGHNFGLGHHTIPAEVRYLMYWTTAGGCFIPKAEADVANP